MNAGIPLTSTKAVFRANSGRAAVLELPTYGYDAIEPGDKVIQPVKAIMRQSVDEDNLLGAGSDSPVTRVTLTFPHFQSLYYATSVKFMGAEEAGFPAKEPAAKIRGFDLKAVLHNVPSRLSGAALLGWASALAAACLALSLFLFLKLRRSWGARSSSNSGQQQGQYDNEQLPAEQHEQQPQQVVDHCSFSGNKEQQQGQGQEGRHWQEQQRGQEEEQEERECQELQQEQEESGECQEQPCRPENL
jgi:hypothetical protein